MTLHDMLSGERRTVHETRGSQTLVARDAVLARIVDHDGVSLLRGVHLRPLPPATRSRWSGGRAPAGAASGWSRWTGCAPRPSGAT